MMLLKLGSGTRNALAFAHDLVVSAGAWWLAYWFRFNLDVPAEFVRGFAHTLPWVVGIYAALFWKLGLYRGLWRYASLPDLRRIIIAVSVGALAVPAVFTLAGFAWPAPRSAYLISPLLMILAMGGSRLAYRAWKEQGLGSVISVTEAAPVVVLGAGRAAATLLKELATSRQWRVVALLDDDTGKRGGEIIGVKVHGPLQQVAEIAERYSARQAIIAMPEETHSARKRAVELCTAAGLSVMTVPSYADLVSGKVNISQLRKVELDDLLGRDPVQLDDAGLHSLLDGKRVLVTGAGGSIGSELCRQIARFAPERVVLLEMSEFALYTIESEFRDRHPGIAVTAVIGDVKSAPRMNEVLARFKPHVIFHAAAYKHVPLMEQDNAWQAVQNNVLGTLTVARAARDHGVEKFILISTDKAVNPTNVMGATKRLAELVCQAVQAEGGAEATTQFVIVRFGNVLGSTGSVIPRFREQIARGGPVTVTHPDIQRYFMSIPEAAQLVLQAALMGTAGQIFVLDMGEPVKIVDLARQLIRLSGYSEADIKIEFTGLRPGEKLFEELLTDSEHTLPTPHPKLHIARARAPEDGRLIEELMVWTAIQAGASDEDVRARLREWIPEYGSSNAAG
jgi:FlaA1/EpsC-like NDP-sugar epimerase